MKYILMHKKTAVAEIEIDDETASISRIGTLFAPKHIPIGISLRNNRPDRGDLNDWWHGRSIPASRQNFRETMEMLGLSSAKKLITKCFGLSLSDQYWVNPTDIQLDWEKINFFDNPFSEDVGNALFGKAPAGKNLNLTSPDNTSDGWLKKKWKIIDGKRCLIKGGSAPFYQEPFNEVFASAVMRRLNINHAPYEIIWEDGLPYSVCEDFITSDTELVGAFYIHNIKKISDVGLLYKHFIECCINLGIPDAQKNLDKMLVLDYLINNKDRHLSNFGAVRNAETLEWLGLAPIYDSGASLWHNQLPANFDTVKTESKPFLDTHDEQIKLVTDFSWFDFTALTNIAEELDEILRASSFIDTARRDALCFALRKRTEMLMDIVTSQEKSIHINNNVIHDFENEDENER